MMHVMYTQIPTSYIVGILEHTQPLRYTTGKGGMRDTSWPTEKHKVVYIKLHHNLYCPVTKVQCVVWFIILCSLCTCE